MRIDKTYDKDEKKQIDKKKNRIDATELEATLRKTENALER